MKVNAELFREIADIIEANPSDYAQEDSEKCIFAIAIKILGLDRCDPTLGFYVGDNTVAKRMGLSKQDAQKLCCSIWKPREGLTAPEALREIAAGKSVSEVSA